MSKEDLFDQAEEAGIDFTLTKPIVPSVLYNGIVEIFDVKPPEKRKPPEQPELSVPRNRYHILLVEDNKTNQFIAQTILEQAGFRVSKADNGKEGYEFYMDNRDHVDLILMDVHMPVMNGYEATDLIRESDSDVPIIAMTADAVSGVIETCRSHGMDHYVSKPFEPEQFIQTVAEVLNLKSKPGPEPEDAGGGSGGESVLDAADGIKRIGGDRKVYRLILEAFAEENAQVTGALREKLDARDYAGAVQVVHKIKSSAGNIGAKPVYEAASALQQALKSGEATEIVKEHAAFEPLLRKLLAEIADILKEDET
jgi:CheY-like chemotaxis protein/HPt (histidine-containing phosphotransfer) domain-containing protein